MNANIVKVTIHATDKSWKPRFTDATLTVRLKYIDIQGRQLGFTQPEWIIDVFENWAPGDLKVLELGNQETYRISCSLISGNIQGSGGPVFSIRREDLNKNCILTLMSSLDFKTQQRYDLVVRVDNSIYKRQAYTHQIFIRVLHLSAIRHGFTVCVEGNIASGKTTFLEYFKKFSSLVEKMISLHLHCCEGVANMLDGVAMLTDVIHTRMTNVDMVFAIHEEPVKQWQNIHGHNALAKLYENPERWALTFQTYVQMTLLNMHLKKQKHPIKLAERSIYSAKYCFVENLHRNKSMPDLDYVVISEWFDWILKNEDIKIDLMVYLRTRPEVVYQRIKDRNRIEEQRITLEHLQALHDRHEEWLIKKSKFYTPCHVLVLDANSSLSKMHTIYEERKSEILFGHGDA